MWSPSSLMDFTYSGNEYPQSYVSGGVGLWSSSHDWFSLLHMQLHTPLCLVHTSSHQVLMSCSKSGHLLSTVASPVPQFPSPHEIGMIWQSSSKPHHPGQSSKTWTDRHWRHTAPGWSGGPWQPLCHGGSSGSPSGVTWQSRPWQGGRGLWLGAVSWWPHSNTVEAGSCGGSRQRNLSCILCHLECIPGYQEQIF